MKILGPIVMIALLYVLFRNDAALFTALTDRLAAWLTGRMLEG